VASNADTVGRLLATSTLMKGERELLRKQDEPAPEAASSDISVTYRWDKAKSRYVKDSDAFEKLSVENAKRF